MATEDRQETLTLAVLGSVAQEDDEVEEEREIRELEREVREMGLRILDHRKNISHRLDTLSSRLVAQRPLLPPPIGDSAAPPSHHTRLTGASGDPGSEVQGQSELGDGAPLPEAVQEKLHAFRAKATTNIAAMPAILNRMKESITMLNKVEDYGNIDLHPVFKGKRKH